MNVTGTGCETAPMRHCSNMKLWLIGWPAVAALTSGAIAQQTPMLKTQTANANVGAAYQIDLNDAATVSPGHVRIILRSHGDQSLLTPRQDDSSGATTWRFTPKRPGTHVIAATAEPPAAQKSPRVFRYEKHFIRVAPAGPQTPETRRPSASATARFGHRLELAPMVDPAWLIVGSDLPIRVKFDGLDLKNVELVATCRMPPGRDAKPPDSSAPATDPETKTPVKTVRVQTGDSSFANLLIRSTGLWTVTLQHRPIGSADKSEIFIAIMQFTVTDAPAIQTPREKSESKSKDEAHPKPGGGK